MMEYQTFRWRIHANTPTDIDTVLNALPAGTFVEGYATAGDELFITVSHYEMAKVTVYQFTKYDIATDQSVKSRRWATREAIEEIGATVLESTAVLVCRATCPQCGSGRIVLLFDLPTSPMAKRA
jgi:hypothetical protein